MQCSPFFVKKAELKIASTVFRSAETGECYALRGLQTPAQKLTRLTMSNHPRGGLRHIAAPSLSRNEDARKRYLLTSRTT